VRELGKGFGGQTVLRDVRADVPSGGLTAVLGPSGSGKTTLLRLVAGLDLPDAGSIEMDGRVVSRPGWALEPHRRGVGFAFQRSALWPHMTVAQNVLFGVRDCSKSAARARLSALLADLELGGLERRYPDQLSGGQARRVALARALAPEPPVLLLDEPLTNLEAELKERLAELVRRHIERTGATTLYVTHDGAEARRMGATVLALTDGRLAPVAAGASRAEVGP